MLSLVYPMGSILLAWLLYFLLFSGLGLLLIRALRGSFDGGAGLHDAFWLGWAGSLCLLQVWHIVLPVDERALWLLGIVAALSLTWHRAELKMAVSRLLKSRVLMALLTLSLLWMANRAIEMPDETDTGLRDIQAVMWIDAYPVVPGLNNLHASLAYNHSVYLYDALLDVGYFEDRAYYIATGLLVIVLMAYGLHGARGLLKRGRAGMRWSGVFATLTLPYLFFYTVGRGGLSHFLTDTAVDLLGFLTLIYLLDFLQDFNPAAGGSDYQTKRLIIVICAGFTVKQTFWVFGLGVGVLVLAVWLWRGGWVIDRVRMLRVGLFALLTAAAFMLPWMLRGVVTSGYVAYPQLFGRVDVEWAEPVESVMQRQEQLATNTRLRYHRPEVVLASWDWVKPWLGKLSANHATFTLPLIITAAGLMCWVLGGRGKRRRERGNALGLWIFFPLILMLLFWFFSLPNYKYVRYIVWSCGALAVLLALLRWEEVAWRLRVGAVHATVILCLAYGARLVIAGGHLPLPAGPADGFYAHHVPPIKVFVTDSGDRLNTPDSHIGLCWEIPLPCTPSPRPGIYLRVPGELRHGFGYDAAAD